MKILGYILVFGGFAAMNWGTMEGGHIIHKAALDQLQRMPASESYSRGDVGPALHKAASATWNSAVNWFYFPGVAMLAGSLIATGLFKRAQGKAQRSTTPNGGPQVLGGSSAGSGGPPSVS